MNIDWNEPFLFGVSNGSWAMAVALMAAPFALKWIFFGIRSGLIQAIKNFERTVPTALMLGGGLILFSYAKPEPVTGSEVLRMIMGTLLYVMGFMALISVNKKTATTEREAVRRKLDVANLDDDTFCS